MKRDRNKIAPSHKMKIITVSPDVTGKFVDKKIIGAMPTCSRVK
jgi:hypothetical protein